MASSYSFEMEAAKYLEKKLALTGPVFSLDVECVATGRTHQYSERSPAKFALVSEDGRTVCMHFIKPSKPVVSYLTPISGVRSSDFDDGSAIDLASGIALLKHHLPSDAILVGQRVDGDIDWMKLKRGVDFKDSLDLAEIFKSYNPKYRNTAWHSLLHEAKYVLGLGSAIDASAEHDPALDARLSVQLWNKVKENPTMLKSYRNTLLLSPRQMSIAKRLNWCYEGVCLCKFNPKQCSCGAPTGDYS